LFEKFPSAAELLNYLVRLEPVSTVISNFVIKARLPWAFNSQTAVDAILPTKKLLCDMVATRQ
jgi:hypothetical protein